MQYSRTPNQIRISFVLPILSCIPEPASGKDKKEQPHISRMLSAH